MAYIRFVNLIIIEIDSIKNVMHCRMKTIHPQVHSLSGSEEISQNDIIACLKH